MFKQILSLPGPGLVLALAVLATAGCGTATSPSAQHVQTPEEAELERLRSKLGEFDLQIANGRKLISEQARKLDGLRDRVEAKEKGVGEIKEKLASRKRLYDQLQSPQTRDSVFKQLEKLLTAYKADESALVEMRNVLGKVQAEFDAIKSATNELQSDRDELARQLEVLELKLEAARIQGQLADAQRGASALQEARELALELEARVEVQSRILKEQQVVSIDELLGEPRISDQDFAELDKLLDDN